MPAISVICSSMPHGRGAFAPVANCLEDSQRTVGHSEVILGRFLAESQIGVGNPLRTTNLEMRDR
jgi:hypothetical protein